MGPVLLLALLVSFVVSIPAVGVEGNELKMHFYKESCPNAEDIVRNVTWTLTNADPDLAPDLLRLHYHDCFVRVPISRHNDSIVIFRY